MIDQAERTMGGSGMRAVSGASWSRRRRRPVRTLGVLAAALVITGWLPALAVAKDTVAFRIGDERITESSGLAADLTGDRYWTVNDSGDAGVVYALDGDGRTEGTLQFRAQPTDVEALALRDNRLWVADIGDNAERRPQITVYFFDQPAPQEGARQYRAVDFSYPDGPHDAETLLVDPGGRLFVVTKELRGGIYRAPRELSRDAVNQLKRVGDAPAFVTDGVFLPDGDRIALRTYVSVEILDAASYDRVAGEAAPRQPQGESMTVSLDGESLLLGSEGANSKVYEVPIPTAIEDGVPSPSASPPSATPSPTPSPTPTATTAESAPEETEEATPSAGRQGTLLAVGLAGVVALVSGLVVVLVRK